MSKQEQKIDLEKFMKEACSHCQNNPNAEKPYTKMVKVPVTGLTMKLMEQHAETHGLTPDCWTCLSISGLLNTPIEELIAKQKQDHAKD